MAEITISKPGLFGMCHLAFHSDISDEKGSWVYEDEEDRNQLHALIERFHKSEDVILRSEVFDTVVIIKRDDTWR